MNKAFFGALLLAVLAQNSQQFTLQEQTTIFQNCDSFSNWLNTQFNGAFDVSELAADPTLMNVAIVKGSQNATFSLNAATGASILASPLFNRSLPVFLYIPSHFGDLFGIGSVMMTNALANKGGMNVLTLAPRYYDKYIYLRSIDTITSVGNDVTKMLVDLKNGGISPSVMSVIGHGLGAHIAGYTGRKFQSVTSQTLKRVTGLDPAGDCFYLDLRSYKISPNDATQVDVIHTDGNKFGTMEPLGQTDFYPNGGSSQPMATSTNSIISNHLRAVELFVASLIAPDGFPAVLCSTYADLLAGRCGSNSKVNMGFSSPPNSDRGSFYLTTTGILPYYMGNNGISGTAAPPTMNAFEAFINQLKSIFPFFG